MSTASAQTYIEGILHGDRVWLSRAITLVESTREEHRQLAREVVEACIQQPRRDTIRLGITGVPGVGKSTFIEALGMHVIAQGHRPAVLAIDPSSSVSKGSILGDKTRMNQLAANKQAYIRPSPSRGNLGGVAANTREAMLLCEAAGFDVIFIETVGVGQSETVVKHMVDTFLLLMLAGAGDELQGMKRGIMEMADLLVINKADGDNVKPAEKAATEYRNALHLFPPGPGEWTPPVTTCSSLQQERIDAVWQEVLRHRDTLKEHDLFEKHRQQQRLFWFREGVSHMILEALYKDPAVRARIPELEAAITNGNMSSLRAAEELVKLFGK